MERLDAVHPAHARLPTYATAVMNGMANAISLRRDTVLGDGETVRF